jgi:hypothetical protein
MPDGVPVACPMGPRTRVIHGHSRTGGHAADLRKRCSEPAYPEPSKTVPTYLATLSSKMFDLTGKIEDGCIAMERKLSEFRRSFLW